MYYRESDSENFDSLVIVWPQMELPNICTKVGNVPSIWHIFRKSGSAFDAVSNIASKPGVPRTIPPHLPK